MKAFRSRIKKRLPLRLIWMSVLGLVVLFGNLVSWLLIQTGARSYAWRHFVCVPLCYFFFFALVKLIGHLFHESLAGMDREIEREAKSNPAAKARAAAEEEKEGRGFWDWLDLDFDVGEVLGDWEILALLIFVIAVVLIVAQGPTLLADIIFDAAFSAGLIRAVSNNANRAYWYVAVFRRSIIPVALYWVASVTVLYFLASACPGHLRVSGALGSLRDGTCSVPVIQ